MRRHTLALSAALGPAVAAAYGFQQLVQQLPLVPGLLPGASKPSSSSHGSDPLQLRLAHVFHHGTSRYPDLHRRLDVHPQDSVHLVIDDHNPDHPISEPMPPLYVRQHDTKIQRLVDRSQERIDDLLDAARWYGEAVDVPASEWAVHSVPAPNITDRDTVLTMARIASNAYVQEPNTGNWEDVGGGFNYTEHFGWEKDGIRGHVFADTKNSTVVIGLKGTTMAIFDGSGTTTNDKLNDNLFFGCCCGQGAYRSSGFCDCQTETFTCNSTCVRTALRNKNRYYYAAKDLYHNVTALYPDATIWWAGHSLGGAVSSLVAITFGLPAVTFEAPGEAMAAKRLGLPTPPGYSIGDTEEPPSPASYHFGHNADPIYTGNCGLACYTGGYAMESVCHSGYECVYNTTGDGFGESIRYHSIQYVLHNVFEVYKKIPKCEIIRDCNDCYNWKFFESNSSTPTTTSGPTSTSATQTRTATCKTPGWWGCLDETTTTTESHPTTTTTTTSTCKTPGWFGCKDPTTTTSSTTTTDASQTELTTTGKPRATVRIKNLPMPRPSLDLSTATASHVR